MNTLAQTNTTNDISVSNGDFVIASGLEAYGNILADAVRTVLGEIQLDVNIGIDYLNTVFDSSAKIQKWENSVRRVLTGYKFVKSIGNISTEYSPATRTLNYSVDIYTDLGKVTVEN